jgi:CRP/FNR family transcriptional regulator, cyclic AMP receptor protein
MSDRATVDFLATVPLFEDSEQADLAELAGAMRRRTAPEGQVLWRQGDDAREMAFVVDGGLSVSLRVAGGREVQIARAGPGEMVGEIALIDGGPHTMSVSVTEPATLLVLGRQDLAALLARQHPSAFGVKRRLAALFTARLRNTLRHVAGSLGDGEAGSTPPAAELEYCTPPDSRYLRRMATFHEFDRLAVWGFLTSGRYARCEPGRTLLAEGTPSTACYLTINGAVEKVVARGDGRIRIGLAGPGKAFGYESLIDGGPSPITAITRERALLLVLSRDPFERLFTAEDAISRVFLDVLLRDSVATLRQTLSPLARTADSRPT